MMPPGTVADPEHSGAGEGGREPSDLFSIGQAKRSIPSITAIPLTKEEIRRRRLLRATLAAIAVALTLLAIVLVRHWRARAAVDEARLAAERSGRLADIEAALALVAGAERPDDIALAARLHASAVLEGISDHRAAAEELLEGHDPSGDGASDHRIAETYLALAEGDPSEAAHSASALVASGPRAAEAARARALAALAIGNAQQALLAARAAVTELPDSPRHRALLAVIASRAGEEAPLEGDSIPMRIARARVRWDRGEQREHVGDELASIADDASATPAEKAWARLLTALAATDRGDTRAAAMALEAAGASIPPGDEVFRIALAEGWLSLHRRLEAQQIADTLSPGISADAGRRAQMMCELHLLASQVDLAESALSQAPATPRTTLLRARIADARDQPETARPLYEEAARAPSERLAASVGLAAMMARQQRAAEAIALVEPLLRERATHPRVAALAASAYLAAGQGPRALEIAEAALREHSREPILLAAKAQIHLAASEWQPALEALRIATEVEPRDAALQADRGRAARELGQIEEARAAFQAAIEIDPANAQALATLLAIQLETGDLDGAGQTLARLDAARITNIEIERLRANYLVDSLAGHAGISAVQRARRTARRDHVLAYALARLHVQAESWYDAIDAFEDAMPPEGLAERRDVALWRILAFARAQRRQTVEQLAEALREGAAESPFSPREESRLLMAEAWAEWHDGAFGRAAILARRALDLDPQSSFARIILAGYQELQHQDPTEHLRAALAGEPPSVEALGMLAEIGEMDEERCAMGRRYLRAAPDGDQASAVRERLRACPAAP